MEWLGLLVKRFGLSLHNIIITNYGRITNFSSNVALFENRGVFFVWFSDSLVRDFVHFLFALIVWKSLFNLHFFSKLIHGISAVNGPISAELSLLKNSLRSMTINSSHFEHMQMILSQLPNLTFMYDETAFWYFYSHFYFYFQDYYRLFILQMHLWIPSRSRLWWFCEIFAILRSQAHSVGYSHDGCVFVRAFLLPTNGLRLFQIFSIRLLYYFICADKCLDLSGVKSLGKLYEWLPYWILLMKWMYIILWILSFLCYFCRILQESWFSSIVIPEPSSLTIT